MSLSAVASSLGDNPTLQRYYALPESRIGYSILLGGARHFGYYEQDTYWPFPILRAVRKMEDHLHESLDLPPEAVVLDAGCGEGHVAVHLAKKGLHVRGVDLVDRSIAEARRNVVRNGIDDAVSIEKSDYHDLGKFADHYFDGVYTMEAFVHSPQPIVALAEFLRVLKPGGSLALYEYEHDDYAVMPPDIRHSHDQINRYTSLPTNARSTRGTLPRMLKEVGFENIVARDLSTNVMPMVRLFYVLAYIPWLIVKALGLQPWFINTVAAVEIFRGKQYCSYVAVTAKKPRRLDHDTITGGERKKDQ